MRGKLLHVLRLSLNIIVIAILTSACPALAGEPSAIESASFLPESAWNRDDAVVQYNSFVGRDGGAAFVINSEWAAGSPDHQLAWSLPIFLDRGAGAGDFTFTYRYQLLRAGRGAVAGRATAILPTRNPRFGDAISGLEIALPISFAPLPRTAFHSTASARWLAGGHREGALTNGLTVEVTNRMAIALDSAFTLSRGTRTTVVRPSVQFTLETHGVRLTPSIGTTLGDAQTGLLLLVAVEHDM